MTVCPKCGSSNTYEIAGDYACRMCGKRWPIEGARPIIVTKPYYEEREEDMAKKYSSGKKGVCVNCGRERYIADAVGLCGMCHNAVKGIDPNDLSYADALKKAKARCANTVAAPTRSAKKVKTSKPKKPVLDHTIKQIARAGLAGIPSIIAQARAERDGYLAEAEKLNKAINILESL
jgi:hypothetical protein